MMRLNARRPGVISMHATYDSLTALGAALSDMGQYPVEYYDKMVHTIPAAPSVDRGEWLFSTLAVMARLTQPSAK